MPILALLGCDLDVLRIAARAAADAEWQVAIGYDVPAEWRERLLQAAPGIELRTNWESLLADSPQVVLVGRCRTADQAEDQLRKLVQAAVPLALSYPLASAIFALELEMIRRDAHGPICVVYPGCRRRPTQASISSAGVRSPGSKGSPGGAEAATVERPSRGGVIAQVVIERRGPTTGSLTPHEQLARDLQWLWPLLGDFQQVTAVAAGGGAGNAATELGASLHVQVQCEAGILVRWSHTPGSPHATNQLRLEGPNLSETWESRSDLSDGAWTRIEADVAPAEFDSAVEALESLRACVESSRRPSSNSSSSNASRSSSSNSPSDGSADWPAAVRALEAVDAAQHSARRGRTIELQKTQVSEESTFKGVMSAVGCLLLLSIPLILVIASLVDRLQASFRPRRTAGDDSSAATTLDAPRAADTDRGDAHRAEPNERRFPWFAVALAVPIVAFLLLQFLQLVFHPAAKPVAQSSPPATDSPASPPSKSPNDRS